MPAISLSDGSVLYYDLPVTPLTVAADVASSLSKDAFLAEINGKIVDINSVIVEDAKLVLIDRKEERALAYIRHDCAHILAEAVLDLYPDAQATTGLSIDSGFYYDFYRCQSFTLDDLNKIEQRMHEIVDSDENIVREEWTRDQALEYYKQKKELFKVELTKKISVEETIIFYRQGNFLDLCLGPHGQSTKDVGHAFKLMNLAGAYWCGDSKCEQLQRIYGTVFADEKALQLHIKTLKETEKRDHRRIGRELDLFHIQEDAVGSVFWHPKGWILYREIEMYLRRRLDMAGYQEVRTPQLIDQALWEASGHWHKFNENMFTTSAKNDKLLALKPMNCPGHVQVYKQGIKSYRDLPLRLAEFGSCHRNEPSGALHGVMRVRSFTQDDAHIFCTESQITEESIKFCDLLKSIYADFSFHDIRINFSDRPAIRAGTEEVWDRAESALRDACIAAGLETILNPGEGAFYGPKIEFILRDAIGRDWQCGTLQVDFVLPERLDATYVAESGDRKRPVILHRAILGSMERWIGILIEQFAGRFPMWLSPVQLVVATITNTVQDYALEVAASCKAVGCRVALDLRNEKINYKVREHSETKIPALLIIGTREAKSKQVVIRRIGERAQEILTLDKAVHKLSIEALAPDCSASRFTE
ncbi:threonyl-tRNA synthetase [Candidatus Endolissoclinum faulkneri L5]|uniref:Threonine--tRNA ligase n=1 Tax=Candidatus Endolissoclinum faulkneri L5 TaxID=1401328 RepID=V9TWW8_9PROT|nr:threonine--tRNA ligase [Candidatus Endolissoclinum faulkneri]AHC73815.1 threonyl-tRNA synthetase [Candidatus Endolissoclinum faulkneri L5]